MDAAGYADMWLSYTVVSIEFLNRREVYRRLNLARISRWGENTGHIGQAVFSSPELSTFSLWGYSNGCIEWLA
jgi:hypothetical protein